LNEAQRVEEIARLMSGEEITEAALETAKSLMM
jgi:DNA repair ATPase RecN